MKRCKKRSRITKKVIKLPEGGGALKQSESFTKIPSSINKSVEDLVEKLLQTEWQCYSNRPKPAFNGYFVIFRWYRQSQKFVPIYVDRGYVANRLDRLFSGDHTHHVGKYLSSFCSDDHPLIWFKWMKDLFFPGNTTYQISEIAECLSVKYNDGNPLVFNSTKSIVVKEKS